MTGRQFLIEKKVDSFLLRLDFAMNGKKPNWITLECYPSLSTALLGLYEVLIREERSGTSVKMRRMKISVLFDEEKVDKVIVKQS